MRFSIVTPCLNAAPHIEAAIRSVQAQDWADFEHIVVDGGSTDGTVEILRKYPHLRWVSERDGGQADAMRKGFALSTGAVIGYLNADDAYLGGAFAAVAPHFEAGEKFVVGQVQVRERRDGKITEWLNDPRTDFASILRHWEPQAFCVNPVGYFYAREVQEACPFNADNADKMDLEFLLDAVSHVAFKKVDRVLGIFNLEPDTKTAKALAKPGYWWPKNFPFLERFIDRLPETERSRFRKQRDWGYQLRRKWAIDAILGTPQALELIEQGEIVPFPRNALLTDHVMPLDQYAAKGDAVILIHQCGKVASSSVVASLLSLNSDLLPAIVVQTHTYSVKALDYLAAHDNRNQVFFDFSISHTVRKHMPHFTWNCIALYRDPITIAFSVFFELLYAAWAGRSTAVRSIPPADALRTKIEGSVRSYILEFFKNEYLGFFGLDILEYPFDRERGYSIIERGNLRLLLLKVETLDSTFERAIEAYLGVPGVPILNRNQTLSKPGPIASAYEEAKRSVRFGSDFLDEVYGHPVVRHFFTDKEIAEMRKRWEMPK